MLFLAVLVDKILTNCYYFVINSSLKEVGSDQSEIRKELINASVAASIEETSNLTQNINKNEGDEIRTVSRNKYSLF